MFNAQKIASASSRLVRVMSHVASADSAAAGASAASTPWKEIRIPVPWGHIAGKEWGMADGAPLLGLHGWQDNCSTFDRLAPLLPLDKFRFISIDLPGHGLSSHFPAGTWYHLINYVATVARIADYFNWSEFSLLSHSMGSKISFVYAGCYPEKIKSLVSVEMPRPFSGSARVVLNAPFDNNWVITEVYRDWIEQLKRIEKTEAETIELPFEEFVESLVKATGNYFTMESARIIMKRGTKRVSTNPDLYALTRDRRLDIYDFLLPIEHYNAIYKRINCDLLLILATRGLTYYHQVPDLDMLNKGWKIAKVFQMKRVEGTHYVHLNNPERVAQVIDRFLHKDHFYTWFKV